jgi:hypothetical protein
MWDISVESIFLYPVRGFQLNKYAMKHLLFVILAIFLTSGVYSQKHFLDISGGANVSKVSNFAYDEFLVGPAVGVGYEFRFAHIMGLQTGLMYNQRGGKYRAALWDNILQEQYNRNFAIRTQYISLPVLLGLISTGDTYGFGRFGVMVSYLLDANSEIPVFENGEYIAGSMNLKHWFNQVDVVGVIQGGMGSAIGNRFILEGALAMQVGLTNAAKQYNTGYYPQYNPSSNSIELPNNPHVGFSLVLAVKYKLGSKAND